MLTNAERTFANRPDFQAFWTSYDPSDAASGSLDPLGFQRAYLALADGILPGLTTVTTVPRYVSMLCAAIVAVEEMLPSETPIVSAKLREKRLAAVKSFERAWALAWGLAHRSDESIALDGLRGVRYVNRRLDSLRGSTVQTGSFSLLANQVRYGGLGTYATLLEGWHFASMDYLASKDLGRSLAEAFPAPELDILDERTPLSLEALTTWGRLAHAHTTTARERKVLVKALQGGDETNEDDRARWRTCDLLRGIPESRAEARELGTLRRKLQGERARDEVSERILAALRLIEPFEEFFQGVTFLFDELRAQAAAPGGARPAALAATEGCRAASRAASHAASTLLRLLDRHEASQVPAMARVREALAGSGLRAFAAEIQPLKPEALIERILLRHRSVQAGKFDDGVPKGPWLVSDSSGTLQLAGQRFQLDTRARYRTRSKVPRHPYRTASARAFLCAGGLA